MSPTTEAYTEVVELCALLQCLGFSVKSLGKSDSNMSQENGTRTVVINCQASGLHMVLESSSSSRSCPPEAGQQNSGVWHVSGIAGGQRLDKEFGCSILGQLPKSHRERLSKELRVMMRSIRENSDIDVDKEKPNKFASMIEVKVSPERHSLMKAETPTRNRSLDTLTAAKEDQQLPTPGLLQKKPVLTVTSADDVTCDRKLMFRRQSTYTLTPPGSVKIRNKTSSPLQQPRSVVRESLIAAEKAAEGLRLQLATIIKQFTDESKDDSSMSSLVLDVSKISILKGTEPMKTQFASSPNLSGLGTVYEDMKKNKLLGIEGASSSGLVPKKQTPIKDGGMTSKLRRISPNFFKKNTLTTENDKLKPQDTKNSKLNSILKPKAPVTSKLKSESSQNLSASSKKRFSHVKSTIPRPKPKKE